MKLNCVERDGDSLVARCGGHITSWMCISCVQRASTTSKRRHAPLHHKTLRCVRVLATVAQGCTSASIHLYLTHAQRHRASDTRRAQVRLYGAHEEGRHMHTLALTHMHSALHGTFNFHSLATHLQSTACRGRNCRSPGNLAPGRSILRNQERRNHSQDGWPGWPRPSSARAHPRCGRTDLSS